LLYSFLIFSIVLTYPSSFIPVCGWIAEMTKRFFFSSGGAFFIFLLWADYRAARAEETSVKRGDQVRKGGSMATF
jgi:hypothetical protein